MDFNVTKFAKSLGIDRAVFFTLLSRLWIYEFPY